MDIVESCVDTAPPHLRNYIQTMVGLGNVPRKEKQFRNFTSNSLNLRGKNEAVVGQIWDVLQAEREKRQKSNEKVKQQQQQQQQELEQKTEPAEKQETRNDLRVEESTKVSDEDIDADDGVRVKNAGKASAENESKIDVKKVKKAMKKALKKAPNRCMKVKEMRKFLLEQFDLPSSAKKRLKEMVLKAPELSKSKIVVDGKMVTLR